MVDHFKFSMDQSPKVDAEDDYISKVSYVIVIGCFTYVMVCSTLDLTQVVIQVCKFISKLGKRHWEAIRLIFMYLKDAMGRGNMFRCEHGDPSVVRYIDSNYIYDMNDTRSTTRYIFTL